MHHPNLTLYNINCICMCVKWHKTWKMWSSFTEMFLTEMFQVYSQFGFMNVFLQSPLIILGDLWLQNPQKLVDPLANKMELCLGRHQYSYQTKNQFIFFWWRNNSSSSRYGLWDHTYCDCNWCHNCSVYKYITHHYSTALSTATFYWQKPNSH